MSDKGDRRRQARMRSAETSSQRQESRLSLGVATDEAFAERSAQQDDSGDYSLSDEDFAIFGLDNDPALRRD